MMRVLSLPLALAFALLAASTAQAYDHSEAESCAGCHFYPGSAVMTFTVDTWYAAAHSTSLNASNGNSYCARCHSPFQADPAATHHDSDPVPPEDWESITCSTCHPPHDLRVEWGTPIGIYDVDAAEWFPVYEAEANQLCQHCHSGSRHQPDFQGFGQAMFEHKDVRCIDCHMPEVPNPEDPGRLTRTHDLHAAGNLPYSCGTVEGGCHDNHKPEWAAKQIGKGKIHGK